jgi:hypothetical protein
MLDAVLEDMHARTAAPVTEVGPLAQPIRLAA